MASENGTKLTYESYIRATPDRLWQAITDGEITAQYFYGSPVQSTWRAGDEYVYLAPDRSARMAEGRVVEVEPNQRVVLEGRFLWDPKFLDDPTHREAWEIEDMGSVCKLTVTFDQLEADSPTYRDSAYGLPMIVSGLKSLLETGEALAFPG